MKCVSAVCALLLFLPVLLGAEMTLEEVRGRYIDAVGGLDRFRNLKTLSVRGNLTQNGEPVGELTLVKKRPHSVRTTVTRENGERIIQGYDGTIAWARIETKEQIMAGPMKTENAVTFVRSAPIENALVNPQLCGATLSYAGLRSMEANVLAHVIVANYGDNSRTEHYIDAKTFIERKSVTFREMADGSVQLSESIPSDHRRIDGVLVAFRNIERDPQGNRIEIMLTSVEFNVGVFDALFAPPISDENATAASPNP
jgi:outer membrane lipoprotein-sorting protein